MKDRDCIEFLQWALPRLGMRWAGFRKVRRQVGKRLDRRLRELHLPDIRAYRELLGSDDAEWSVLDALCRISISRFYRDRGVFDELRYKVLPDLARQASVGGDAAVRCLSAGCCSGEEPYTLASIWHLALADQWPQLRLEIVAVDADPHLLERARRGCYPPSSVKDFPGEWLDRVFQRRQDGFQIRPEVRAGIEFVQSDIRERLPAGPFRLILCRYLAFTYFDRAVQERLLAALVDRLVAGGVLVIGQHEALPVDRADLVRWRPHLGIYRFA